MDRPRRAGVGAPEPFTRRHRRTIWPFAGGCMTISSKAILFLLLLLFVLGWSTESLTLFDIGRYSFPLILFVGLPFSLLLTYRSLNFLVLPIASSIFAMAVGFLQGVEVTHILSQAVLQTLAITFAAGIAAINWHQHRN